MNNKVNKHNASNVILLITQKTKKVFISGEFRTWTSYILRTLLSSVSFFFFRNMNGQCIPTLMHHRRTPFFGSFFQVGDYFSYFFLCAPLQETTGDKAPILTAMSFFLARNSRGTEYSLKHNLLVIITINYSRK